MLRRDFLGSTLGFFTTTSIPWIARPSIYKKSIPRPNFVLPFYKTALRLDNGLIIQGPGIKEITEEGFIYTGIDPKVKLTVKSCILIYKNQIASEKEFDMSCPVDTNQTFNIKHKCSISFNDEPITPLQFTMDNNSRRILNKEDP